MGLPTPDIPKRDPICRTEKAGGRTSLKHLLADKQNPFALDPRDRVLQLQLPENKKLRVRNVVSRSKSRPTGKFPSRKNGRMNHWESPHELNAFRILEADSTVVRFEEQPLEILYLMDGIVRRHIPDIRVFRVGNEKELWEVKTSTDAADSEVQKRTQIMQVGLPALGYSYRLVTSADLETQPQLDNAVTITKLGYQDVSIVERESCRRFVADRGDEFRWADLELGMLGPRGKRIVSRLILEGLLSFDMSLPLKAETVISATAKGL